MDVKNTFDYISQIKLGQVIKELKIDNDMIGETQSFLTDRKINLVNDRHISLEKYVKIRISQDLPVFFILFLIYISAIFDAVFIILTNAILVLIIDNFGFLVNRKSI